MNNILLKEKTKTKILESTNLINEIIKTTIGPKGKNVIISSSYGNIITNDGIEIAKKISVDDQFTNALIDLIKDSALQTSDEVGDGTTTTLILTVSIIENCLKRENLTLRTIDCIKKSLDEVVRKINVKSKKLQNDIDLRSIANIASSNEEIGLNVYKAFLKCGKKGKVNIEENCNSDTIIEENKGYLYERGFISNYFVNDLVNYRVVLDNCNILIIDGSIEEFSQLQKLLEEVSRKDESILIVCDNISEPVLNTILVNNAKGNLKACIVKKPFNKNQSDKVLEDVAIYTNTKVFKMFKNSNDDLNYLMLGKAYKVICESNQTYLVNGQYTKERFEKYIEELEEQKSESRLDSYFNQDRISNLLCSIVTIKVGASTPLELAKQKEKYKNAINAVVAAQNYGIVAGGGICLYDIATELQEGLTSKYKDYAEGLEIMIKALRQPFINIIENCDKDSKRILSLLENKSDDLGYDANNDKIVNMYEAGIIDASEVIKCAIKNAVSIACLLVSSEAFIIYNIKKKFNDIDI